MRLLVPNLLLVEDKPLPRNLDELHVDVALGLQPPGGSVIKNINNNNDNNNDNLYAESGQT